MLRSFFTSLRLLFALFVGALRALWFLLKTPQDRRREAKALMAKARVEPGEVCPLVPAGEGLFRIPPSLFGARESEVGEGPIVIYFTGTGETPHAPLPTYSALVAAAGVPALSRLRHFVVDAPVAPGAYYGSQAFSSRLWERVSRFFSDEPGPFVLVGLSRGALAALEVGARLAEEQNKVASVLALSPPLSVPQRLPDSVVHVASLERVAAEVHRDLPQVSRILARFSEAVVRRVHLTLTALLHVELGMTGSADFRHTVFDFSERGVSESALRATREFRFLVEAPDRELLHFVNRIAGCAARSPCFFALCAFGRDDAWAEALRARERLEQAALREHAPTTRLSWAVLEGRGHGLFRERGKSPDEIAILLARVFERAHALYDEAKERAQRQLRLEQALYKTENLP